MFWVKVGDDIVVYIGDYNMILDCYFGVVQIDCLELDFFIIE